MDLNKVKLEHDRKFSDPNFTRKADSDPHFLTFKIETRQKMY